MARLSCYTAGGGFRNGVQDIAVRSRPDVPPAVCREMLAAAAWSWFLCLR